MKLKVEIEGEDDGRRLAEVVDLPGVLAYGSAPEGALRAVRALALRVLADKIEHGEEEPVSEETDYLLGIAGMRESILEGMVIPLEETSDEPGW